MPTDTTITRYGYDGDSLMMDDEGQWVRYEDHERALTAALAARDAAERERDELQERSYQMIAGIEADAATLLATKRDCSARVEQALMRTRRFMR